MYRIQTSSLLVRSRLRMSSSRSLTFSISCRSFFTLIKSDQTVFDLLQPLLWQFFKQQHNATCTSDWALYIICITYSDNKTWLQNAYDHMSKGNLACYKILLSQSPKFLYDLWRITTSLRALDVLRNSISTSQLGCKNSVLWPITCQMKH